MDRLYYIKLLLGIVCIALITITFYLLRTLGINAPQETYESIYSKVEVNHPIQPIPTLEQQDQRWVSLGKALFHSPLLSGDNSISCASCHLVNYGGDDGFSVSTGVASQIGSRNSPTVLNSAFNFRQFWDGRALTLEEQIEGPINNPVEMASGWPEIIKKLSNDSMFLQAFNSVNISTITPFHIKKAIAIYERSLITPNSPIDRFLLGDKDALSEQQKRGLDKFVNYGCVTCH